MYNSLQQPEDRKLRVLRQEKRIGFMRLKTEKGWGSAEDMISQHLSDVVRNIEGNVPVDLQVDRLFKTVQSSKKGGYGK
jgi:hypothetical protein